MPFYYYICKVCGNKFNSYSKVGDHSAECPKCKSTEKDRDYQSEFSGVQIAVDTLGEGFNYSAGVWHKNRQDLHEKMRAKGLEPMNSRSFGKTTRPIYLSDKVEATREKILNSDVKVQVE